MVAWELGRGMGHINRLLPIASALSGQGHRVVFAFRSCVDLRGVSGMLPHADILQAPVFRLPLDADPSSRPITRNYADILFQCGYRSADTLGALVGQWHTLFATVGPDLIICDHSPTVLVAAGGRIPVLHVGSGFVNPPAGKPLAPLSDQYTPGAEQREMQVLESIVGVRRSLGSTVPAQVSDLFDWGEVSVTCLPELDPYRTIRDQPALGPVQKLPRPVPPGERVFVFGYLAGKEPRVADLLRDLARMRIPCCMYVRQAPLEWQQMLEDTSVRLFDMPQRLPDALVAASAVLHHGGLATAELALAAGRPQFILPRYLEQLLTADTIQRMGCGVNLLRSRANAAQTIRDALTSRGLESNADALARRIEASAQIAVVDRILERCKPHLT